MGIAGSWTLEETVPSSLAKRECPRAPSLPRLESKVPFPLHFSCRPSDSRNWCALHVKKTNKDALQILFEFED